MSRKGKQRRGFELRRQGTPMEEDRTSSTAEDAATIEPHQTLEHEPKIVVDPIVARTIGCRSVRSNAGGFRADAACVRAAVSSDVRAAESVCGRLPCGVVQQWRAPMCDPRRRTRHFHLPSWAPRVKGLRSRLSIHSAMEAQTPQNGKNFRTRQGARDGTGGESDRLTVRE